MEKHPFKIKSQLWFIGTWPSRKIGHALHTLKYFGEIAGIRPPLSRASLVWLFFAISVSFICFWQLGKLPISKDAAFMGAIVVWATILWVTEAIPLFATALSVIALEVIFISNPGAWPSLGSGNIPFSAFLSVFAEPVLALFLGGFILARGAVKEGIDQTLAAIILKRIGTKPMSLLFSFMVITAVFSMWMSNTATTAMMLTLIIPILSDMPIGERFKKGMLLSIPIAANIGGMATPTGSSPNAAALGFLSTKGMPLAFPQWMALALPFCLIMLALAAIFLWFRYKPQNQLYIKKPSAAPITMRGRYVIFIFISTITLWLTEPWHGLPAAVVSFWPVVAFTAGGLLDKRDINFLDWDLILLLAGGLALGLGVSATGLDQLIVPYLSQSVGNIMLIAFAITLFISTFMSNTAAANLLVPISGSLVVTENATVSMVVGIALMASLAMSLPVSTPPNALAYAKGDLKTIDFLQVGLFVGVLGWLLLVVLFPFWQATLHSWGLI